MIRRPAALAPEPGAAQLIGEVSGPAERLGVRAGMRLGEALSRCPELALIPPDPERAERAWEGTLRRFESGSAPRSSPSAPARPSSRPAACAASGAGSTGVLDALAPAGRRAGAARRGAGALLLLRRRAARAAPPRAVPPVVVPAPARAVPLPPAGLAAERAAALRRRGRCRGRSAQRARAARHRDPRPARRRCRATPSPTASASSGCARCSWPAAATTPLRPRRPFQELAVELELPDAVLGPAARARRWSCWSRGCSPTPARRGRTFRALRLSARLAAGGGWRRRVHAAQRRLPSASGCATLLVPLLSLLPGPAAILRLEAVCAGPGRRRADGAGGPRASSAGARSPRRCARPAPPAAARRSCGCSRSTRPPASPSGARC